MCKYHRSTEMSIKTDGIAVGVLRGNKPRAGKKQQLNNNEIDNAIY